MNTPKHAKPRTYTATSDQSNMGYAVSILNSSVAAPPPSKNIQQLPTEVIEKIANNLKMTDLRALRATSRTIQAKTTNVFVERVVPDHQLSLQLTIKHVQTTLEMIEYDDIAEQIHSIAMNGCGSTVPRASAPLKELLCLLKKLFAKLPNLRHVKVYGYRHPSEPPVTSCMQVLTALVQSPLMKLESLELIDVNTPVSHVLKVLEAQAHTLKRILFRLVTAHQESVGRIRWTTLLAYARDHMNLDNMSISDFLDHGAAPYHAPAGTQWPVLHRTFRDPDSRKICYYSVADAHGGSINMAGKRAVKLGLNQALRRDGRSLYDPEMPEK